jgi:hypothetical protein
MTSASLLERAGRAATMRLEVVAEPRDDEAASAIN